MALQRQNVPVILGNLDTFKDEKLVLQGSLLTAENCYQYSQLKYEKRNGLDPITALPNATTVANYKDELIAVANDTLYSYSPNTLSWVSKGSVNSTSVSQVNRVAGNTQVTFIDRATTGNITALVYAELNTSGTESTSYIEMRDNNTDLLIFKQTLSALSGCVRVCASGDYFIVANAITTSNTLNFYSFYSKSPATQTPASSLSGATDGVKNVPFQEMFDIATYQNASIVSYRDVNDNTKVLYVTRTGQIGIPVLGYASMVTVQTGNTQQTQVITDGNSLYVGILYSSTSLDIKVMTNTLTVSSTIATTVSSNTVCFGGSFDGTSIYLLETIAPAGSNTSVVALKYTAGVLASSKTFVSPGLTVMSRPFIENGKAYGLFLYKNYNDSLQNTLFMLDFDEVVYGRFIYGYASAFLSKVNTLRLDGLKVDVPLIERLSGLAGGLPISGVSELTINPSHVANTVEFQDSLFLSGSILYKYDSQSCTESDFLLYPDNIVAASSGAGSTLLVGSYQISIVYEWIDAAGRITRSAPDTFTFATVATMAGLTYTIPPFVLTSKRNVKVCGYRTTANGTIPYKVFEVPVSTSPQNVTESITEASLVNNEILYTVGGTLENMAVSGDIIRVGKKRILIASKDRMYYSKDGSDTESVSFNAVLSIQLPYNFDITDMVELDDKIIIFTTNNIFVVQGEPPDNTGSGPGFALPQKVASDIGCTSIQTSILFNNGVLFQSSKGIYLLSRGLQVSYVGAAVQKYNSLPIVSSVSKPEKNLIVFFTTQEALTFNYLFDQWTVYKNMEAIKAVVWQEHIALLKTNGSINVENDTYTDGGNHIPLVVETNWLALAGINGFQRLWGYQVLGKYEGPHILKISMCYDYANITRETILYNPTMSFIGNTYGTGVYGQYNYGEDTGNNYPYNPLNSVYQYLVRPMIQKCQSIKIRIEDMPQEDNVGSQGLSINSIVMNVGLKQGMYKNGSTNKIGGI